MSNSKYINSGTAKTSANYSNTMARLQWDFLGEIQKVCEYYDMDMVTAVEQFANGMGQAAKDIKNGLWF